MSTITNKDRKKVVAFAKEYGYDLKEFKGYLVLHRRSDDRVITLDRRNGEGWQYFPRGARQSSRTYIRSGVKWYGTEFVERKISDSLKLLERFEVLLPESEWLEELAGLGVDLRGTYKTI